MSVVGIIPARYASHRFPAKALVDIKGQSMIQRVYAQASQVNALDAVVVATDHAEIFDHVKGFGGNVCMTDVNHRSGTDRCFEAAQALNTSFDFVINIQGDEPFIHPQQIDDLARALQPTTEIATQANIIKDPQSLSNPNEVKVLINKHQKAAYFSRSAIPYIRDFEIDQWLKHHDYYRHVGIYAYRYDILQKITALPASSWEQAEGLEQLRWLQNGYEISVFTTEYLSYGIDTPDDLQRVIKTLEVS